MVGNWHSENAESYILMLNARHSKLSEERMIGIFVLNCC